MTGRGVPKNRKKIVFAVFAALFSLLTFAWLVTAGVFLVGNKINGYYTFGGTVAVVSGDALMEGGGYADSVERGAMVFFDTSVNKERGIAAGQIVLIKRVDNGVTRVAARRVSSKTTIPLQGGKYATTYVVAADSSAEPLPFDVSPSEILGVYRAQSKIAGEFFSFLNSFGGFSALLLLPTVIAVIFSLFLVFSYLQRLR